MKNGGVLKQALKISLIFMATFAIFCFSQTAKATDTDQTKITVTQYKYNSFQSSEVASAENAKNLIKNDLITWIDIQNGCNSQTVSEFADIFEIDTTTQDELIDTNASPKIEEYDNYLFLALKMPDSKNDINKMNLEQINIIWSKNYILTFSQNPDDDFADTRKVIENRIQNKTWGNNELTTEYLAYIITDTIVDNYFSALNIISQQFDNIEKQILDSGNENILEDIYHIKREVTAGRKAIWPMRNVFNSLVNYKYNLVSENIKTDFQNTYDNINYLTEVAEIVSQNNSELVSFYLSVTSYHTNDILKFLTIVSTILLVLSFVAALYGINFSQFHTNDKKKKIGHIIVIFAMIVMAIALIIYFKINNWI